MLWVGHWHCLKIVRINIGIMPAIIPPYRYRFSPRVRKYWKKQLVFRCRECLAERVVEVHHTNKKTCLRKLVCSPNCRKNGYHANDDVIEMRIASVAMSHVESEELVSRHGVNNQEYVPLPRRCVKMWAYVSSLYLIREFEDWCHHEQNIDLQNCKCLVVVESSQKALDAWLFWSAFAYWENVGNPSFIESDTSR